MGERICSRWRDEMGCVVRSQVITRAAVGGRMIWPRWDWITERQTRPSYAYRRQRTARAGSARADPSSFKGTGSSASSVRVTAVCKTLLRPVRKIIEHSNLVRSCEVHYPLAPSPTTVGQSFSAVEEMNIGSQVLKPAGNPPYVPFSRKGLTFCKQL